MSPIIFQKQLPKVFCKKKCSQKFRKIHWKTPVPEFKLQVFSSEFCEFSKNTFFTEHLRATASDFLMMINVDKEYEKVSNSKRV